MKKLLPFLPLLAVMALAISCSNEKPSATSEEAVSEQPTGPSGVYNLDINQSVVKWRGDMLGIKFHEGTLNLTEGTIIVDNGRVTGGKFVADLSSMVPTDENYQPETGYSKDKLVTHLKSADFFDVANYPTAIFNVTGAYDNNTNGKMTIRGRTHNEVVKDILVTDMGNGTIKATGQLNFDRQQYGVSWSSGAKDAVLSDNIALTIELVAVQ